MYMGCTFSQGAAAGLCTSGVVYPEKPGVHAVYMPPALPKRRTLPRPKREVLRWHANHISEWREDAGYSQQQVSDLLAERGIELDRVSIGRIEGGKQVTSIENLEAMAKLFGTDVTSMIDRTPAEARDMAAFTSLDASDRRRLIRLMKADQDQGE